jgi:hypothetical protein
MVCHQNTILLRTYLCGFVYHSLNSTLAMKNRWYIGEGYNGGLTTLEACVILAVTIYLIIEVMKWIN